MTPIPGSAKSMGTAAPVLLTLAVLCWLGMLGSIAKWIGKPPVIGRETDRMILQAYSGVFALLLWILLAGLLLVANSKQVMPAGVGAIAWLLHPLSGVAALIAIVVLYDPQRYWPAIIPATTPVLIAGYVLHTFSPSVQPAPIAKAGFAMWALVGALSVSIVPEAIRFRAAHRDTGSIEAKPGPEMDRWVATERERRRAEGLAELQKSDGETRLYELDHLIRSDSPVLQETLEFMRHLPNRQADVIQMLRGMDSRPVRYLADIDLRPTEELCNATRQWLHEAVRHREQTSRSGPESFVGAEFEEGLNGIAWIANNCGCDKELAELEAYARGQQQDAPAVQKFLAALAVMREKK